MKLILLLISLAFFQTTSTEKLAPLFITLDDFTYPYPVKYYALTAEGKEYRMAYMDVAPMKNANGKVVVLMHGKNFGSFYWKNTIAVLQSNGYRVIAIDQLGFGKSSKPNIHYSFHLMAFFTNQLLHSLGITKADIIGHSTGGMIATRYTLLYPDEVDHLLLEDPIGLEDYRQLVPYNTVDSLYHEELTTPDSVTTKYIKNYFVKWKPEYQLYADILNRWKRSVDYPTLAKSAALTTEMIYEQPVCYEFGRIKVPTLIVVGNEDRTVIEKNKVPKNLLPLAGQFPEMARQTAAQITRGTYKIVDSCGHIPHLEKPEEFHQAVLKFLKE